MRVALIAVLMLAACGQPTQPAKTETPSATTPAAAALDAAALQGRLIVDGEDWRLDSDPQLGVILNFPTQDLTLSGPYVTPEIVPGGARLQSNDINLALTTQPCTMKGAVYPMTAVVTFTNSSPQNGCAVMRWDRALMRLMPQIDACLAVSPGTRRINYAGEQDGVVLVRMESDDANVDCRVRDGAASVAPRDEDVHVAGERDAIFIRAPGANPGGECYEAPEVHAADGSLLGWMDDPQGC